VLRFVDGAVDLEIADQVPPGLFGRRHLRRLLLSTTAADKIAAEETEGNRRQSENGASHEQPP